MGMLSLGQTAFSQPQPATPDDYAYLARLHVRPSVINCVAELDSWIRSAARYDMFLAPDRHVLKAKVEAGARSFTASASHTVESTVTLRAFARLRPKSGWVPVIAKCAFWHQHVVGVSVQSYDDR
ncbi:hypothetical protein CA601_34820 [Paraburkholderia hospita]|nr:hypothetical protein CA601_34820 [Paraburkholderia hospita]OUL83296.1 hypothetical protein CA603_26405 [Paraburkholderia hospita]OUL86760.1 hypothetical protein CA602_15055 [Paraburkholderia hospita]